MAKRIMFFTIGSQVYGLDVAYTQGIEKAAQYLQVPNTVSHIMGIITLRGEIIPVYSLRTRFGMSQNPISSDTELIIVTLSGNISIALVVDGIREISEVGDASFSKPPALLQMGDTGYIGYVIQTDKLLAIMIGLDGLLSKEEKEKLQEFIKENEIKSEEQEEKDTAEKSKELEEN